MRDRDRAIGVLLPNERREAEDKDGSMSDTSILCTRGHDLANQPMTKSQYFRNY